MAEVVVKPDLSGAITQPFDILGSIFTFFADNWAWMLFIVILIILVIVIFIIIGKLNEERKERDEPGYQLYKTTKAACSLNADHKLIRKKPRYGFIWLFLTPFFWVFFLLKSDSSARILDYTGRTLGFYRGELTSMDNTLNILAYKVKWLIFFESAFVIKIPQEFKFKEKIKDSKGNFVYESKDGKKILKYNETTLRFDKFVRRLNNGDIQLEATGLEQVGMYYKCPTFVIRETGQVIDYRKLMEGAVIDSTYQQMTTRLLNLGAKMMEKGMQLNPSLQYAKQSPEKTKPEEEIDRQA